jgi:phosphoribosyl 1,2-cyclic phosphate phosphodiesterase
MKLFFLGTGTSHGVPMIGCDCEVCRSKDPRNHRGRSSIHVVMGGQSIQVDAAPELRLQCVREGIREVDLFILTHEHADHLAGLDDLRRFCDSKGGKALDLYSTPAALARLSAMFPYAMCEVAANRSYLALRTHTMPQKLELPGGTIESVLLPHGRMQTLGLVFTERETGARLAYYTDCKTVPDAAVELARGSDVVVLDGLRPCEHPTHMTISEATAIAARIGAPLSYLTHLTHNVDHGPTEANLPPGVLLGYDGLRIEIPGR